MRLIQFEIPGSGRRVGAVEGQDLKDLTAVEPRMTRIYDLFAAADEADCPLNELVARLFKEARPADVAYADLLAAAPFQAQPFLHPPLDHAEPGRVEITGTGLTHLGSMQSRNKMHAGSSGVGDQPKAEPPPTDSAKMFEMGLQGGRPAPGQRGVAPEWFYKGNGTILRGHRGELEIPAFALDGGEEPELVGCYIIDQRGIPRRLGFALGNEWSDHATERINYLYLAPSKLRTCAVGPELNIGFDFRSVRLRCTVRRDGAVIYDSGDLYSGEEHMSHSLANCEDHHFKYPQHRRPGDVHLHFFGTSMLSYSTRSWKYKPGDEIVIEAPDFGAGLVNVVRGGELALSNPVRVEPA